MACKDFSRSVFHGTFFTGRFSQGVFHGGRRPPRKSGRVTPVACEDFSRGIFHGVFVTGQFSRGVFHGALFTGSVAPRAKVGAWPIFSELGLPKTKASLNFYLHLYLDLYDDIDCSYDIN